MGDFECASDSDVYEVKRCVRPPRPPPPIFMKTGYQSKEIQSFSGVKKKKRCLRRKSAVGFVGIVG